MSNGDRTKQKATKKMSWFDWLDKSNLRHDLNEPVIGSQAAEDFSGEQKPIQDENTTAPDGFALKNQLEKERVLNERLKSNPIKSFFPQGRETIESLVEPEPAIQESTKQPKQGIGRNITIEDLIAPKPKTLGEETGITNPSFQKLAPEVQAHTVKELEGFQKTQPEPQDISNEVLNRLIFAKGKLTIPLQPGNPASPKITLNMDTPIGRLAGSFLSGAGSIGEGLSGGVEYLARVTFVEDTEYTFCPTAAYNVVPAEF